MGLVGCRPGHIVRQSMWKADTPNPNFGQDDSNVKPRTMWLRG